MWTVINIYYIFTLVFTFILTESSFEAFTEHLILHRDTYMYLVDFQNCYQGFPELYYVNMY